MADEVDREAVTPRQSGTLDRWKDFAEMAERLSINSTRAVTEAGKGLLESMALRLIAAEAKRLQEAFEHWQHGDPGADLRRGALHRLMVLREEATELGVLVDRTSSGA